MGLVINNCITMTAVNRTLRNTVPLKIFRHISTRSNTALFGGSPGSFAEQKGLAFLEHQAEFLLKKQLPAVILCQNPDWEYRLREHFEKQICVFGKDSAYDPFGNCVTYEHAKLIFMKIIQAYVMYLNPQAESDKLLRFCELQLDFLQTMKAEYFTYANFAILAHHVMYSETALMYLDALKQDGMIIPSNIESAVAKNWEEKTVQQFREFWFYMSRAFAVFRPADALGRRLFSVQELLNDNRCLLIRTGGKESLLVTAALYAELEMLCQKQQIFFFLDENVPIPEDTGKMLFSSKMSFGLYFSSVPALQMPPEIIIQNTDTLVSLGVSTPEEAQTLSELCKQHSRKAGEIPPSLLMHGVQGLPDGSACVMLKQKAMCCAWLCV